MSGSLGRVQRTFLILGGLLLVVGIFLNIGRHFFSSLGVSDNLSLYVTAIAFVFWLAAVLIWFYEYRDAVRMDFERLVHRDGSE